MRLWVPGWSIETMLLLAGAWLLWVSTVEQGSTFIVGASIIAVMRAIERDRRRRDAPTPGPKV